MKPPKSSRAVRPLDERYLKLLTSRICANLTEDSVPLVANLVLPEGATFCEEDLTNTHLRYNYVRHSTTGSTTIENFLLHGFSKDGDWVCLYTSSAETCKDVAEARNTICVCTDPKDMLHKLRQSTSEMQETEHKKRKLSHETDDGGASSSKDLRDKWIAGKLKAIEKQSQIQKLRQY
eukprot:Em0022g460a